MKVVLTEFKEPLGQQYVEFKCEHGCGRAQWLSERPKIGFEYEVEVGCDETLELSHNANLTDEFNYSILSNERNTTFVARVEGVYENGTIALRFGSDIMLVEFWGDEPRQGTWLKITVTRLRLSNVCL